jgi:hypothetical protein
MIGAYLLRDDGTWLDEPFLIDSGADRTTISLETLLKLGVQTFTPVGHPGFVGVGGSPNFQLFRTTLRLLASNGDKFQFASEFVSIMDPGALQISLLGRDILDQCDVIFSRRNNEILLINDSDRYSIASA